MEIERNRKHRPALNLNQPLKKIEQKRGKKIYVYITEKNMERVV